MDGPYGSSTSKVQGCGQQVLASTLNSEPETLNPEHIFAGHLDCQHHQEELYYPR
jgi:hypothetical protein